MDQTLAAVDGDDDYVEETSLPRTTSDEITDHDITETLNSENTKSVILENGPQHVVAAEKHKRNGMPTGNNSNDRSSSSGNSSNRSGSSSSGSSGSRSSGSSSSSSASSSSSSSSGFKGNANHAGDTDKSPIGGRLAVATHNTNLQLTKNIKLKDKVASMHQEVGQVNGKSQTSKVQKDSSAHINQHTVNKNPTPGIFTISSSTRSHSRAMS
ncbi:MAG: hypothetical protein AAGJ74_02095 [Pseudomonadota bacterium]